MINPKISVIIPVYNTGKYVYKCLQSVLKQNFDDLEIIVVNDASTDNSLDIITGLADQDSRIIIVDKMQNEGVEEARFTGMSKAAGTYLCFVDSDDWLPDGSLKLMSDYAFKNNADIVVGHNARVFDRFGMVKAVGIKFCIEPIILDYSAFMEKFYITFFGVSIFPVSMWGKLYRRTIIDASKIKTHGFNFGEDLMFNIQIFPESRKTVLVPDVVYNYRYGGMTSKFNSQLIPSELNMYKLKQEYAVRYNDDALNRFSRIELKNYLKTFIEMLLKFKSHESPVEHKQQIAEIISKEEYVDLRKFYSTQELQGFELAFAKGDIDGM